MYRFVYKITLTRGKLRNHFYYGKHSTNDLNDGYKGSGKRLKEYYKKYPNDYVMEKLFFFDNQKECDDKEYELICKYFDDPKCLNESKSSFGGNMYNYLSEEKQKEWKRKISEGVKGDKNPMYGKNAEDFMSPEAIKEKRRKMSESRKGDKHPLYGKHHSDETKKKMSKSRKGEKNAMYGKNAEDFMSPEAIKEKRRKMSESHKGKHWKLVNGKRLYY